MYRFDYSYPSDASMMSARRTAAIARSVAGAFVVGCILFVMALTGCQQQTASSNRVLDVGVGQSTPPQATEPSVDTQLRLDPSEIMFYTSNVHG